MARSPAYLRGVGGREFPRRGMQGGIKGKSKGRDRHPSGGWREPCLPLIIFNMIAVFLDIAFPIPYTPRATYRYLIKKSIDGFLYR